MEPHKNKAHTTAVCLHACTHTYLHAGYNQQPATWRRAQARRAGGRVVAKKLVRYLGSLILVRASLPSRLFCCPRKSPLPAGKAASATQC